MALELSELRSFLVLAQHLHFGEAAEALHVSQPALTKQIQKLEAKVEARCCCAVIGECRSRLRVRFCVTARRVCCAKPR
jgi:Bacterial regulatory helix-turn-helix protein, lysR family